MISNNLYDAFLFDFDGVILDSEPVHFDCWRQVLSPHGIALDWDTYARHCVGVADYVMLEFLGGRADPPVPADRLWAEYGRKNRLFVERMVVDPPVPAATRELIPELARHAKLAIVSSSGSAEVEPILGASGLRGYFAAVVCGDHVRRHKPDPEPYLEAAGRLGAVRPLVIEDSPAGVASGRAAGFDVLVIDDAGRTADLVRDKLAG